ncbi:MAG: hypothetical protein SFW36_22560 [Leptolyngbyaceae cyanobacterium bins.59]|nr:hypothetical protein [Leptolyngbyaceae cyanobacterium bins.59]
MRTPIPVLSISLFFLLATFSLGRMTSESQPSVGEVQVQESLIARAKQRRPATPHRGSGRRTAAIEGQISIA